MKPDPALHVAYLAQPNELAVREWMDFFARRGHRVTLIARAGVTIATGLDPRISVQVLAPYSGSVRGRFTSIGARRSVRDALATVQPDVVHVHDLTTGLGWPMRLSGFHPYVVTTWGSDLYRTIPQTRASRLIGRLTLSAADLVTVNSAHLGAAAIRAGARRERVTEIQFGVDLDRYRPTTPDLGLKEHLGIRGRRVLFSPRHVAPLYDHASVIRALPDLPPDLILLLSARNARRDELDELLTLARACGVEERLVVVPGINHDDMAAYYAISDVVVSVPRSDATAVTLLEAMACGRPIVATDLPSPREWIDEVWRDGIVPVADPAAIAAAVGRLLELPSTMIEDRGSRAREIVASRADRERNMLRMEMLYRSLVGAGSGVRA
ncbi:MAG: glycosyltransferase family 4 protein [Candidatus Limnocylindrales bacterium]